MINLTPGRRFGTMRHRAMAVLLVGAAVTTWLVAAQMVWVLVPMLRTDPDLAADPALALVMGSFALFGIASAGLVLLVGVVFTWVIPHRATGRVLLFVAGLMAIAGGLLTVNVGTFDLRWGGDAALVGVLGGIAQLAAGLLAIVASLSHWLPGPSLSERMMQPNMAPPTSTTRVRMLPWTAALAIGWLVCTGAILTRSPLLVVGFFGAQWGMPVLAGAVVAGWREGQPNRLQTLGLAGAAGMALDLLLLLVVGLGYYRFDATGFGVWWALMGALFGSLGYGLWGSLMGRAGRSTTSSSRPSSQ